MLEDFRKQLRDEGRSLLWFHTKYLDGVISYTYFSQQAGGFSNLQDVIEKAIKKYLRCEEKITAE